MAFETTEKGRHLLGNLIQKCRDGAGMTLVDFANLIKEKSGGKISPQALGQLENGGTKNPSAKALALIAYTEIVVKPDGQPYDSGELYLIACELIDPETGKRRSTEKNGVR